MKFALLTSGWVRTVELFLSEADMNERFKHISKSSMFASGKYRLATSESNTEYLVTDQYPDFSHTAFRLFHKYTDAKEFIKKERKENISHTYILFERMG